MMEVDRVRPSTCARTSQAHHHGACFVLSTASPRDDAMASEKTYRSKQARLTQRPQSSPVVRPCTRHIAPRRCKISSHRNTHRQPKSKPSRQHRFDFPPNLKICYASATLPAVFAVLSSLCVDMRPPRGSAVPENQATQRIQPCPPAPALRTHSNSGTQRQPQTHRHPRHPRHGRGQPVRAARCVCARPLSVLRRFPASRYTMHADWKERGSDPSHKQQSWTQAQVLFEPTPPDEKPVPHLRLAEYYWSPVTKDKMKDIAVLTWLIRTALEPFRYLSENIAIMDAAAGDDAPVSLVTKTQTSGPSSFGARFSRFVSFTRISSSPSSLSLCFSCRLPQLPALLKLLQTENIAWSVSRGAPLGLVNLSIRF